MNRILLLLVIAVVPLVGHAGECRSFSCFRSRSVILPAYSTYPVTGKNYAQNYTAATDYNYVLEQLRKAEDFKAEMNRIELQSLQRLRGQAATAQQLLQTPPEPEPLPTTAAGVAGIFGKYKCAQCHETQGKGPTAAQMTGADKLMRSRIFVLTVSGLMPKGDHKVSDDDNQKLLDWSLEK